MIEIPSQDLLQVAGAGAAGAALAGGTLWFVLRRRITPGERERRRRLAVHEQGRIADGEVTDVRESLLLYVYSVRGVMYQAAQDVSEFQSVLPEDPARTVGQTSVKYDPLNPGNSIVVCEKWSGLRRGSQQQRA